MSLKYYIKYTPKNMIELHYTLAGDAHPPDKHVGLTQASIFH